MLTISLVAFILTILFNWYVAIWGKQDLDQLKQKISIKKYLADISNGLEEGLGKKGSTITKLLIIIILIGILVANAFLLLGVLVSVALGMYVAKKLFQVGAVSNILHKIATYINRLR